MNYRIIEKEAFRIIGFGKRVSIVFEGVNPEIAALAEKVTPAVKKDLASICDTDPSGIISASVNFSEERMEEKGCLDHYIGAATTRKSYGDYNVLHIEAHTWAVFEAVGTFPDALQDVWGRIYAEWFPSSDYEAAGGPELLWNEDTDTDKPDYRSEIWIPVKKKNGC